MALSLFDRGIFLNWAPRWVDGHYSGTSTLTNFMHLLSGEPCGLIESLEPLDSLKGKLNYRTHCYKVVIPEIDNTKYYINNTEVVPIRYQSLKSLLSNLKDPGVFIQDDTLYLQNFDVKVVSLGWVTSSVNVSGYVVDLQEDGYFILQNENGDEYTYDYNTQVVNDTLYPRHAGNFILYYPSASYASSLNTSSWIESTGTRYTLNRIQVENLWDRRNITLFERRNQETNKELRYKLQCYYLSTTPKTQISSLLGQSKIGYISSASGLSLAGEKVTDYSFYNYQEEELIAKKLHHVGATWYMDHPTSNYIEVITDFGVTSDYTNASGIISINHPTSGVSARYLVENYAVESSGNFFTSITSNNLRPTMVVLARNVLTSSEPKLMSLFNWDFDPTSNYESTTFV